MSAGSIQLAQEGGFLPGEAVSGRLVGAELAGELRLFWVTCGRGTEDITVVDQQPVSASGDFSFQAPLAPYTTSGTLVGIEWGIEWVDEKGDAVASVEIIISPTREVIELSRIQKPESGKVSIFHRNQSR